VSRWRGCQHVVKLAYCMCSLYVCTCGLACAEWSVDKSDAGFDQLNCNYRGILLSSQDQINNVWTHIKRFSSKYSIVFFYQFPP